MSTESKTAARKKFWRYGITICILTFFAQYFFSCLGNDVLNVLKPFLTDINGWTNTQLTAPSTMGGIINIPISFVILTVVMELGPRKAAAIGLFGSAIGVLIMALATDYTLYYIGLLWVKVISNLLNASIMGFVVRWFNKYRGRALGFITIGSPFNSATSVALMTAGCTFLGFQTTFIIVAAVVAVLGVLFLVFAKDQPEMVGCFIDGEDHAVEIKADKYEDVKAAWSIKKIFTHTECWSLFLAWGGGGLIIFGVMAFFVARATMIGFDTAAAVGIMSVAAIAAVPFSYIFGIIDDKIGTDKAGVLMYILVAIGMVGMYFSDRYSWGLYIGGFGAAVLTGAFPNLSPSHAAMVYGRRGYQHVRRYQGILSAIPSAFGVTIFAGILDSTGSLNGAYLLCLALCIVSIVGILLTRRTFDPENPKAVPIPGNTKVGFVNE